VNWAEYKRMTLEEMQKKRWRTTREMRNGYVTIPAGMEVRITYKRGGLNIEGEKCAHCGVSVHISKVNPTDLREIV